MWPGAPQTSQSPQNPSGMPLAASVRGLVFHRSQWQRPGGHFPFLYRTMTASPSQSERRHSSSINLWTLASEPPPVPAPIKGKATERNPLDPASRRAERTESRIDLSDERQSWPMPATWMMALNGNRPGNGVSLFVLQSNAVFAENRYPEPRARKGRENAVKHRQPSHVDTLPGKDDAWRMT